MKTTFITLFALFFLSFSAKSQILIYQYCFDSTSNCAGYLMSDTPPVLTIENTPNNTWEIGQVQKTSFTSGYNSLKAIVTDTLNPYPPNNTSAFLISWSSNEASNSVHWANFRLKFAYNVDSDTLTDHGNIEFSPDNGATWIDLLDVNAPTYGAYLYWDLYEAGVAVPPTLSGNSNGWKERSLDMGTLGYELAIPAGTTILWRFSFTSDGNQTNKDGLMFDDISLTVTPPLSLQELNNEAIHISPNPVISTMDVRFSETSQKVMYRIYSSEGKLIKQFDEQPIEATLDLHTLNPGMYYLTIYGTDHSFMASKKFIKQ